MTAIAAHPIQLHPATSPDWTLPTMAEIELMMIDLALRRCGGNRRAAAELLGMGKRTIYRKAQTSVDVSNRDGKKFFLRSQS